MQKPNTILKCIKVKKPYFLALNIQLFINTKIKYKKQKQMKIWNSYKRKLKTCTLNKKSVSLPPHWPRNSQGKNSTCPIITPLMDNCDGVKTGQIVSQKWCLFLQNQFQCFKEEYLIVLLSKKNNLEMIKYHKNITQAKSNFK